METYHTREKGAEPYQLREKSNGNFKNDLNDIMKLLKCAIKEIKTNKEIKIEEHKLKNGLISIRENIKNCTESINLKTNESDNNSESRTVTEVVSSSTKPDLSRTQKTLSTLKIGEQYFRKRKHDCGFKSKARRISDKF
jgi:hypothetical protein